MGSSGRWTGLTGALTAVVPATGVILLSVMGLAGAWLSARLPEL